MKSGAELIFELPCHHWEEAAKQEGRALKAFDDFGTKTDPDWVRHWDGFEEEERDPPPTPNSNYSCRQFADLAQRVLIHRRAFRFSDSHWDETSYNFLVKYTEQTIEV